MKTIIYNQKFFFVIFLIAITTVSLSVLLQNNNAFAIHPTGDCIFPFPIDLDSDHNCILDSLETDSDGDGLFDFAEVLLETNPNNPDTDEDGLTDGFELGVIVEINDGGIIVNFVSNPLNPDTDGDGFSDGLEVNESHTDPLDPFSIPLDSDADSLFDFEEQQIGTDPNNPDTDGDGLSDGVEVNTLGTDPLNKDTDGDRISDGDEITLDWDPLDPQNPFETPISPTAFDWSMPDRFGLDDDKNGLVDYFTTFDSVNPTSWHVDFDACDLLESNPQIVSYEWTIVGKVFQETTCDGFSFDFPTEGSFKVTLTVTDNQGNSQSFAENVIVQDWLVVSFGDSYASGEGVPDVSIDGVTIAAKINILKLEKAFLDTKFLEAQMLLTGHLEELKILKMDLETALIALERIADFEKTFECAALEGTINFTTGKIDGLTALINAENNKVWYERDGGALLIWEAEKAVLQGTKDVAQFDFDRFECAVFLAEVKDLSVKINEIVPKIADLENKIRLLDIPSIISSIQTIITEINDLKVLYTQNSPQWQSEPDHRSAHSGHAKAAILLEILDTRTSVTFVHLAKSGDISDNLKAGNSRDQIKKANELVGDREIDAVILSIGGNDIGFGKIVTLCIATNDCFNDDIQPTPISDVCDLVDPSGLISSIPGLCVGELSGIPIDVNAQDLFFSNIYGKNDQGLCTSGGADDCRKLLDKYKDLAEVQFPRLDGLVPACQQDPNLERLYQVEYVDATKDDNGDYCGPDNPLSPPLLELKEFEWLDEVLEIQLNQVIAQAASENGWNLVDGIYTGFETHGLCSEDSWMVGFEESFLVQKDGTGTGHPNIKGHSHYGKRIFEEMIDDLYLGNLNSPRAPDEVISLPCGGGSSGGGDKTPPNFKSVSVFGARTIQEDGTLGFGGVLKQDIKLTNSMPTALVLKGADVSFRILIQENSGIQGIKHITMYTNTAGPKSSIYTSDTFFRYDSGKITIEDPNGIFSNENISFVQRSGDVEVVFEFTAEKTMPLSDIFIRIWDSSRNSNDGRFIDAIQIIDESEQTIEFGGKIIDLQTNEALIDPEPGAVLDTETPSQLQIETVPQMDPEPLMSQDILSGWAGYSENYVSDVEFLSHVGIEGNQIPKWFKKSDVGKWVLDGLLSQQEFIDALKFLDERGIF